MHAPLSEAARAKLNLYLHIEGRRDDGYHLLDSLVLFTDLADTLTAHASDVLTLTLDGPFAEDAGAGEHNLVLKAARALAAAHAPGYGAALHLSKQIPVGAGLGGGSADAAATLRALNRFWGLHLTPQQLISLATPLGADVAMCIETTAVMAHGIGDALTPLAMPLPLLHAVLVHPRQPLPTPAVYRALTLPPHRAEKPAINAQDYSTLIRALSATTNDLTAAAISQCPAVQEILDTLLRITPAPDLVRMSGSGACCFALYEYRAQAEEAAAQYQRLAPGHWVNAVTLT